jgi:hypothetical protein
VFNGPTSSYAIKQRHIENAAHAINGYDATGIWRETFPASWLQDAVPIVIDTNILRDCVGQSALRGKPTVPVTIANTRVGRLYCASHVIDEFYKYRHDWAADYGVPAHLYEDAFLKLYEPLLRVVPTAGLADMLLPTERERLEILARRDADDVPSALGVCRAFSG